MTNGVLPCHFEKIERSDHVIKGQSGFIDKTLSSMVHKIYDEATIGKAGYPDLTMIRVAEAMAEVLTEQ